MLKHYKSSPVNTSVISVETVPEGKSWVVKDVYYNFDGELPRPHVIFEFNQPESVSNNGFWRELTNESYLTTGTQIRKQSGAGGSFTYFELDDV